MIRSTGSFSQHPQGSFHPGMTPFPGNMTPYVHMVYRPTYRQNANTQKIKIKQTFTNSLNINN